MIVVNTIDFRPLVLQINGDVYQKKVSIPIIIFIFSDQTGKVITIAMMKTIIQDVNMMVEIAVVIMSTHNTALHVNVWNNNFDL